MINQFKTGIIRLRGCLQAFVLGTIMLAIITPPPVLAHGGFDHVLGTVVKVSNGVVTIKTATGNM